MQLKYSFFLTGVLMVSLIPVTAQIQYPVTKKVSQTDNYHGVEVADPYRWLENDTSAATAEWVRKQNELSFGYLEKIPFRENLKNRLLEVYNYPRTSTPFHNSGYFYFYKNDGLQNQSVLYRKKGLDGKTEVVLDPNKLSEDGTTRLAGFHLSKNGKYAAWGISKGGSDWQSYFVRDMSTGKDLSDTIDWVKVSAISWVGDGFLYSRYPAPEKGLELSVSNENHQVWYHKAGTSQSEDKLIYEDKNNPLRFHIAFTDEDEEYIFLTISDRSKGLDGNSLYFKKFKGEEKFKPLVAEIGNNDYSIAGVSKGFIYISTNENAPNRQLFKVEAANPDRKNWKLVIPEQKEPISSVSMAGGKLFLRMMKDVSSQIDVYNLEGKKERTVSLPGPGNASGFNGKKNDKFLFYQFTSFNYPPTIFKYDVATGKSEVFIQPEISFDPTEFETRQVFYPSKDGTKIPMFIVHKKGIKLDGTNPTLLYAYGGFNVSLNPSFNPTLIAWMEQGGIYASANLRGGSEYGEEWHQAGMRFNKQNVFDDFIAAGEYLIREKYTSNKRLAIMGGSNGGLLVGAVINQRPDLFQVAIPQVGVMDMLRFQKFTIGWNWIAEYGSSDNEEEFKNLYAYSPLHNIEKKAYPATMITTADHDDRVVPAHSFKYAATLQEHQQGNNPVLIRIDTKSGHGASNTTKAIEQVADIYAFIWENMNFTPTFNKGF